MYAYLIYVKARYGWMGSNEAPSCRRESKVGEGDAADMMEFGSAADLISVLNIAMIDLVLAGDNALVVGMAAARVQPNLRLKVIRWGIAGAVVVRILLAVAVTYLLGIVGLTLAGGLLLLLVCWKLFRELRMSTQPTSELAPKNSHQLSLAGAIVMVVMADLSMSLDNVLAVSGAAHGNIGVLVGGLALAILAMGIAASFIAKLLSRYPIIMWLGFAIILFVAIDMICRGGFEVSCHLIRQVSCASDIPGLLGVDPSSFLILW